VIRLAALGVCASLAMNLLTQFGLGLAALAGGPGGNGPAETARFPLRAFLSLSASLFLLWLFFTYVLGPLGLGLYWYLLLYPLSAAFAKGLGRLSAGEAGRTGPGRLPPGIRNPGALFFLPPAWAEFLPPALLVSLHLAPGPLEALALALGFSLGIGLSLGILREIGRRSRFEAVPPFLRGGPLALISLGLLSLIFTSAAIMFFNLSRF
jgi:hypothetical protein